MTEPTRDPALHHKPASSSAEAARAHSGPASVGPALSVPGLVFGGRALPQGLRTAMERRSGVDLSGGQVHRSSARAAAIGAAAYTRGDEIHLGPGHDEELAHEAWHVVQQRQGRVRAQGSLGGLPVNVSVELEAEADREGAASARSAGEVGLAPRHGRAVAPAPAVKPDRPGGPPIQGRWLILSGKSDGFYSGILWQDHPSDGPGGKAENEPPTAWEDQVELAETDLAGGLIVDDGLTKLSRRQTAGRTIGYPIEQYVQRTGKSATKGGGGDQYNPFGRFATAAKVAFLPRVGLHADGAYGKEMGERLKKQLEKVVQVSPTSGPDGAPSSVTTESGAVLVLAASSQFGFVYADQASLTGASGGRAAATGPTGDPSALGLKPLDVPDIGPSLTTGPSSPMRVKVVKSPLMTPLTMATWEGKKRAVSQAQVMGASAGDAAANAGYAKNEGKGWEWLHLIAHSMGGPVGLGPQHSENLVAGTAEANTQMIMVEEALKHIVGRYALKATLVVHASIVDSQRHIAERIVYDFLFNAADGTGAQVFHWEFDPLSRTLPFTAENVFIRFSMRHHLGDGKEFLGPMAQEQKLSGIAVDPSLIPPRPMRGASPGDLMSPEEAGTRFAALEQELAQHGLSWAQVPPKPVLFVEALLTALAGQVGSSADELLGHLRAVAPQLNLAAITSVELSGPLLIALAHLLRGEDRPDLEIEVRGYQMSMAGTVDGVAAQQTSDAASAGESGGLLPDDGDYGLDEMAVEVSHVQLDLLQLRGGSYLALKGV